MTSEEIVKEQINLGFKVACQFYFSLILDRDNTEIRMNEKTSTVQFYDRESDIYRISNEYDNNTLYEIIKNDNLMNIPTITLPF